MIRQPRSGVVALVGVSWLVALALGWPASANDSPPPGDVPTGPSYFVPVHQAEIVITKTTKPAVSFVEIESQLGLSGDARKLFSYSQQCVGFVSIDKTEGEASLSLVPVPDSAVGPVPLSTKSSAWADFDGTVQLTSQGFLASVNESSVGRGPEVIKAAASLLGQVAAVAGMVIMEAPVAGGEQGAARGLDDPRTVLIGKINKEPQLYFDSKLACRCQAPSIARETRANDCDPFSEELRSRPDAERWALGVSEEACGAFKRAKDQQKILEEAFNSLREARHADRKVVAKSGSEYDYQLYLDRLAKDYEAQEARLVALAKATADVIARVLEVSGATSKTTTSTTKARYDFTALPTLEMVKGSVGGVGRDKYPSLTLLDTDGASFAVSPVVNVVFPAPGPGDVPKEKKKAHRFCFRQPIAVEVTALKCVERDANTKKCTKCESGPTETRYVLHPNTPMVALYLDQAAFRNTSLSIAFSELGAPTVVKNTSSSSMAGLTGAVATGVKTLRDEYKSTIESLASITETQRQIALSGLTTEIERLKKEKEKLELRGQTEVMADTYDTVMAKEKLSRDLDLLKAELDLNVAQQTLETQAATQVLKAELARLAQEIELLKRRTELAELQRK